MGNKLNKLCDTILENYTLTERISGNLYHTTNSLQNVVTIMSRGKFLLTPALGADKRGDYDYFLSVSRSPNNSYFSGYTPMFVLDADPIANKYKIQPVDYWGNMGRPVGKSEQEERILSNSDEIPANSVKEIHILLRDDDNNNRVFTQLGLLRQYTKKTNIGVFLYTNPKDMQILDKRKSKELGEYLDGLDGEMEYDEMRKYQKNYSEEDMGELMGKLKSGYKKPSKSRFYSFWPEDALASGEATLHNAKRDKSPEVRQLVREYFNWMKKNGYSSLKDAINDIAVKYWDYKGVPLK